MAYFHRIYGIVPWNPRNFCGINGKNLWHFMNFPNFLLLIYLPSTAMETLKTPSEYSVDFNPGFQEFSMANLEKGVPLHSHRLTIVFGISGCNRYQNLACWSICCGCRYSFAFLNCGYLIGTFGLVTSNGVSVSKFS